MYGWLEQVVLSVQLGIYLGLLYYGSGTCRIRKVSQMKYDLPWHLSNQLTVWLMYSTFLA